MEKHTTQSGDQYATPQLSLIDKTISVAMPNYNDSQYIVLALKAICKQSYPPKEVIVCDDASTDNSIEVIQGLIAQYPCIRLIRNEINKGVNFSVNRAASLATGDYIFFASANDLVQPNFFEKAMKLLHAFPEAGLCFADFVEINSAGEVIKQYDSRLLPKPDFIPPKLLAVLSRARSSEFPVLIAGPSSIIRRDLVCSNQVFIPELQSFADSYLCLTLAYRHGICYIPEFLAAMRRLTDSYSISERLDHITYRRRFAAMLRLLASPVCRGVTPLILHSRVFLWAEPHARTPLAALQALRGINTKEACAIIFYCTEETIRAWTLKESYYLKNVYDRAFARSFHIYDQIRSAIKKRFTSLASREE